VIVPGFGRCARIRRPAAAAAHSGHLYRAALAMAAFRCAPAGLLRAPIDSVARVWWPDWRHPLTTEEHAGWRVGAASWRRTAVWSVLELNVPGHVDVEHRRGRTGSGRWAIARKHLCAGRSIGPLLPSLCGTASGARGVRLEQIGMAPATPQEKSSARIAKFITG